MVARLKRSGWETTVRNTRTTLANKHCLAERQSFCIVVMMLLVRRNLRLSGKPVSRRSVPRRHLSYSSDYAQNPPPRLSKKPDFAGRKQLHKVVAFQTRVPFPSLARKTVSGLEWEPHVNPGTFHGSRMNCKVSSHGSRPLLHAPNADTL